MTLWSGVFWIVKIFFIDGPGISIVWKLKLTYDELSNEILLKKRFHGLTQNNNESFNMTIWERVSNGHYVSLTQLQFGAYNAQWEITWPKIKKVTYYKHKVFL